MLPLHPNPRVRDAIRPILDGIENVLLTEPLEYANFARLLKRARIAITDSGGVQEEAPSLGTPVLVTRDQTERQEGVDAGTLKLVGTNTRAHRRGNLATARQRGRLRSDEHAAQPIRRRICLSPHRRCFGDDRLR